MNFIMLLLITKNMSNYYELLFSPGGSYYCNENGEKTITRNELVSVSASHFAFKIYKIHGWYAGSLNISGLAGLPCETLKECIKSLPDEFKKVKQGDTLDETIKNFEIISENIQEYLRKNIISHKATVSSIDTSFGNNLLVKLQNAKAQNC